MNVGMDPSWWLLVIGGLIQVLSGWEIAPETDWSDRGVSECRQGS